MNTIVNDYLPKCGFSDNNSTNVFKSNDAWTVLELDIHYFHSITISK